MTTVDAIYRALAAEPRRRTARLLADHDGSIAVAALVDGACTPARPSAGDGGPERTSGTSEIALRHVHLPMLDDAAIVDYEAGERVVRSGPELSTAVAAIRAVEAHGRGEGHANDS